jgi:hypothetical protein
MDSFRDVSVGFNDLVSTPLTTRAREQSFNSMLTDHSSTPWAEVNAQGIPQTIPARRNSLSGPSKITTKSKRNSGARSNVSSRRTTSNGMLSPAETETTPALKHLNKFARSTSLEYDIDGFVEEMQREKHNNMLFGDDGISISGDSDVEVKPEAKKPNSGARRPTGAGRTPANWIPPIPGLVEVPATRLRNRQQKEKEKEKLKSATIVEPDSKRMSSVLSELVQYACDTTNDRCQRPV